MQSIVVTTLLESFVLAEQREKDATMLQKSIMLYKV